MGREKAYNINILRYFIEFSYDGTNYHGWQSQPNADSVQQHLEEVLSLLLRADIVVVGAGRTDAGVHARKMVAHFDTDNIIDIPKILFKMNCLLPADISIYSIKKVKDNAHARFDALSRTYRYYVHTDKNPFIKDYALRFYFPLDLDLMNKAAELLLHHDDFESFCKANSDNKTTLCNVTEARWVRTSNVEFHFVITANRFLRNMVRAIVGTLLQVGMNKMTVEQFEEVINQKTRTKAGESVPAKGLFLEEIEYPKDIYIE